MSRGRPIARRPTVAAFTATALSTVAIALSLSGCELGDDGLTGLQDSAGNSDFARGTGSPALATKNTVRIPGEDTVGNAAGAALTVYPSSGAATRPKIISVVEKHDWRAAVTMGVLSARQLGAPILLSEKDDVPDITKSALDALAPIGTTIPGLVLKPKALVAGTAAVPENVARINLANETYEKLSLSVDALWTKINAGKPSREVIVTTADPNFARFALPAGPLAAKTGAPVFFVNKDVVPLATLRAIEKHKKPSIYVVGPPRAISDQLLKRLKRYGNVSRIGGDTPPENAKQAALYVDPDSEWGWGIDNPGHGFVVMNAKREMDIAAATTLSAGAAFGPVLLNSSPGKLDKTLENYLLDIQPGYIDDPSDAVYNRAWLLGAEHLLSPELQAAIDKLLAVQPIAGETAEATAETGGI
ncbi:MAG: cell wall-binding repeat-containing protein [Solirubrobacterales bacterium]